MHYKHDGLGFSFDLPNGWRRDEHNSTLTFYGPRGGIGIRSELIQIQIGGILPRYFSPESREKFLMEPGAQVFRTAVGGEANAVVLRKENDSEISVVRDGIHYTICHCHDPVTQAAIEQLKRTTRFPSPQQAKSALRRWLDPADQAVTRMMQGKPPPPAPKGWLARFLGLFREKETVSRCEVCGRRMEVVGASEGPMLSLSRKELAAGIGQAEQCWECNRLYCSVCYPARPRNTCACGMGREKTRRIGGTDYHGSLHLVKARYLE